MMPEDRTIAMVLIGTGGAVDRRIVSSMPALTRGLAKLQETRQQLREALLEAPESQGQGSRKARLRAAGCRAPPRGSLEPSRVSE